MELEMARHIKDRNEMLRFLASKNVVPVKAPPWADHPFELRRNDKTKRRNIYKARGQSVPNYYMGSHIATKGTIQIVLDLLGVHDESSCKQVRERIKHIRRTMGNRLDP